MEKFIDLLEAGRLEKKGKADKPQDALRTAECCHECKWGSSFATDAVNGRCDKYNRKVARQNVCDSFK